jgi:hypothetical protein
MYEDLKNMLKYIPKDYQKYNLMRSLFICAYYTAQRANTCVLVLLNDVILIKMQKVNLT